MAAQIAALNDPDFKPYADLFKDPAGVHIGVPMQFRMGPENFRGEFYLLYQISKEDKKGERFDLRVFYCDINGLKIKRWINHFNQHFCAKVIDGIKQNSPHLTVTQAEGLPPRRNQIDFLVLGVPGVYIEEVIDRFFRMLKAKV